MEIIILIALGAVLFYAYQNWNKQKNNSSVVTNSLGNFSPDELRLENVQAGGFLQLTNIGPEMEDFDVTILSRHIYREGESTWYELEGDRGDEKVWIEFEQDDELEISVKVKELKLRELGISKSDLEEMDEEEEGEFTYNGEKFFYEDSGEAVFYRHGVEENAERHYYYDFENDKGDKYISAEDWDGALDVTLSYPVKKSQITVLSNSKKEN